MLHPSGSYVQYPSMPQHMGQPRLVSAGQSFSGFPTPVVHTQNAGAWPAQYNGAMPMALPSGRQYSQQPAMDSSRVSPMGPAGYIQAVQRPAAGAASPSGTNREMTLEQRVRELEAVVDQKDSTIKALQSALTAAGGKFPTKPSNNSFLGKGKVQPRNAGVGGRSRKVEVAGSKPSTPYQAVDQDDPIDVRLEEFFNSTNSQIQFRRINRGFYRFGETVVELDLINHKLMAMTEDGWNRQKFGPIEKFLVHYESIEREKAGECGDAV